MLYADYNGSSPLLPTVKEYLIKRLETPLFANPNAIHSLSMRLKRVMEKSRQEIATVLNAHPHQIIFNSGATEGISTILRSILNSSTKKIILTSAVEHSAIIELFKSFGGKFEIIYLPINRNGKVLLDQSLELIKSKASDLALVNLMSINNETGVIQPFEELATYCRSKGIPFFSDTTQLIGKKKFDFEKSNLDYAVCSGHKLGALSGSGFMLIREPSLLNAQICGHQEEGKRGGTQHYLGIETLAIALKYHHEILIKEEELQLAKKDFEVSLKKLFSGVAIIGEDEDRLAGTSLVGIRGLHGQGVQIELESQNIFVTTSSACTDNQPETSSVLKAMGVDDDLGRSVIRISFCYSQTKADYDYLLKSLTSAYNKLLKIKSYS